MTAAKFLIADRAKRNEEFVQLGSGDESGAVRMTLGHLDIEEMLFRYLDTVGDGSGTKTANGNYSVTPQNFLIKPYSAVPGNLMNIRWDFTQTSSPLVIPPGWSLVARMRDNLSGLTNHSFFVMGHRHIHGG